MHREAGTAGDYVQVQRLGPHVRQSPDTVAQRLRGSCLVKDASKYDGIVCGTQEGQTCLSIELG